ncbi:MAG: hypothetical protein IT462_04180 [Planctomycetes bacterium]|nr:hypothetical protein [Planctomycetota bacterium]
MRSAKTKNSRNAVIVEQKTFAEALKNVPAAPFGALLVVMPDKKELKEAKHLAKSLIECGCVWVTIHAGKGTHKLHEIFDKAIVDYELEQKPDEPCMTTGEDEDNLEESVRDAVHFGFPTHGEPLENLYVVIVGEKTEPFAARLEGLAKTVEAS